MDQIENAQEWIRYLTNTKNEEGKVYIQPLDRELIIEALSTWLITKNKPIHQNKNNPEA